MGKVLPRPSTHFVDHAHTLPWVRQLSLTGITFIASSGDGGVAYSQAHECLLANGSLVSGNPVGSFVGQLPASCPFVTAVGATSVAAGNSVCQLLSVTTRVLATI